MAVTKKKKKSTQKLKNRQFTVKELAEIVGVSPRAVSGWSDSGFVEKLGRGKYNPVDVFEHAVKRHVEGKLANNEQDDMGDDLLSAKLDATRAKVRLAEMNTKIQKLQVIPSGLLIAALGDAVVTFRSQLQQLAMSSPEVAAGRDSVELDMVLMDMIDNIFKEHLDGRLSMRRLIEEAYEELFGK